MLVFRLYYELYVWCLALSSTSMMPMKHLWIRGQIWLIAISSIPLVQFGIQHQYSTVKWKYLPIEKVISGQTAEIR